MTNPVDNRSPEDDNDRLYEVYMTKEEFVRYRSDENCDYVFATTVPRVDDSRKYRQSRLILVVQTSDLSLRIAAPVRDTKKQPRKDSDDEPGSDHPKSAEATAPTTSAAASAKSEHV